LQFLTPDWPAPENVRALSTVRQGGGSSGAFESFNLGAHVGDDLERVKVNRALLRTAASLPSDPVWMTQIHGTQIVNLAEASSSVEADGAYSNAANRVCAVLTADCLPIFLCNRDGNEVGLLHGGWRGLAGGIVAAGVSAFRSSPDELLAWLGPAIGPQAYEVGANVREAFVARDPAAAAAFAPGNPGKWFLDLYALARQLLAASGVRAVYGGAHCTVTQGDLFFSYRRDGVTGRMASLIWLA